MTSTKDRNPNLQLYDNKILCITFLKVALFSKIKKKQNIQENCYTVV